MKGGEKKADQLRNFTPKEQYGGEFPGCWRSQKTETRMRTAKNRQKILKDTVPPKACSLLT